MVRTLSFDGEHFVAHFRLRFPGRRVTPVLARAAIAGSSRARWGSLETGMVFSRLESLSVSGIHESGNLEKNDGVIKMCGLSNKLSSTFIKKNVDNFLTRLFFIKKHFLNCFLNLSSNTACRTFQVNKY